MPGKEMGIVARRIGGAKVDPGKLMLQVRPFIDGLKYPEDMPVA